MNKQFWWKDDAEIGSYHFCYDEAGDYDFYVDEVAVRYDYGWTEEERQRRFKGAKFVFGGCAGGVSYSKHLLAADNIADAKKEFEAWYGQYLSGRIEGLKKALVAATEDCERFQLYKKASES